MALPFESFWKKGSKSRTTFYYQNLKFNATNGSRREFSESTILFRSFSPLCFLWLSRNLRRGDIYDNEIYQILNLRVGIVNSRWDKDNHSIHCFCQFDCWCKSTFRKDLIEVPVILNHSLLSRGHRCSRFHTRTAQNNMIITWCRSFTKDWFSPPFAAYNFWRSTAVNGTKFYFICFASFVKSCAWISKKKSLEIDTHQDEEQLFDDSPTIAGIFLLAPLGSTIVRLIRLSKTEGAEAGAALNDLVATLDNWLEISRVDANRSAILEFRLIHFRV